MQEWLNWPAWKASKRQKRFKGSNPFLSATVSNKAGLFPALFYFYRMYYGLGRQLESQGSYHVIGNGDSTNDVYVDK